MQDLTPILRDPDTSTSYFFHDKRHHAEMGEKLIAQFLSSLGSKLHVSASTQNQALNAILFLYRDVLLKEIGYVHGVIRANKPHRLQVVLRRQAALILMVDGAAPTQPTRHKRKQGCVCNQKSGVEFASGTQRKDVVKSWVTGKYCLLTVAF